MPENYVVKQGDCMASIGMEHGFLWQTLWNLDENSGLHDARKDPYVLFPGDKVFIPDPRIEEQPCATNKRHQFKVKGVTERLRIVLTDEDDKPLTNQRYVLEIETGPRKKKFEGQTDGSGAIEQSIPPNARKGHLVVGEGEEKREYAIGLGQVDPVEETTGLQGRLLNLGYYDGAVNGRMDEHTTTAILLFQDRYDLPPTGVNDPKTQAKAKEIFGC